MEPRPQLTARAQIREYEAAADRIAAEVEGPILDWGCGLGQVSMLLRARGLDVTSFDYDPTAGGVTQHPMRYFPEAQMWSSPDPVRLPFDDDSFDAVLSMGVLEHVGDPPGSLAEVRRVLRPGGSFYVYKLPNRFSYLEWIARRAGLWYHGLDEPDRLYDRREAEELLRSQGFSVQDSRLANMLPLTMPPHRPRLHDALWRANRRLDRVPGLNRLATNVELVATAPR